MEEMYRPWRTTRRLQNFQDRPQWYRIKNVAGAAAQVSIYDEIGFMGVPADLFMRDLADIDGDIEMHINSPGGDIFDGIAIYNQLNQRKGDIAVVVDGLAASAASFIAQAASPGRLAMAPHSQMMIHNGFGGAFGDAKEMRKFGDLLDKATKNVAGIYADRSGKPADYWIAQMAEETWYDDHEAVAEGLADYILGHEPARNRWDLSVYAKAGLANRDFTQDERDAAAAKGHAMPDGSFPIETEEDLHNAIRLAGNAKDPAVARKHIIKRAKAIGHPEAIPDSWNADGSTSSAGNLSVAELRAMLDAELSSSLAGKE